MTDASPQPSSARDASLDRVLEIGLGILLIGLATYFGVLAARAAEVRAMAALEALRTIAVALVLGIALIGRWPGARMLGLVAAGAVCWLSAPAFLVWVTGNMPQTYALVTNQFLDQYAAHRFPVFAVVGLGLLVHSRPLGRHRVEHPHPPAIAFGLVVAVATTWMAYTEAQMAAEALDEGARFVLRHGVLAAYYLAVAVAGLEMIRAVRWARMLVGLFALDGLFSALGTLLLVPEFATEPRFIAVSLGYAALFLYLVFSRPADDRPFA